MSTPLDHINMARFRMMGFRSRYVQTSLGQIHLLEGKGSGPTDAPPLVMIHGVSSRSTHFGRVIQQARGWAGRIVLPDALGHGLSEAPAEGLSGLRMAQAMGEALDQTLDAPGVIFGNSMGGFLAVKYANRSPDRTRALVLVSPAGGAMPLDQIQPFLDRFRPATHADALGLVDRIFAERFKIRHLMAWAVRRQLALPRIRELLDRTGADDLLAPEELAGLSMPLTFIWGQSERVLLPEHKRYFLEHLPAHAQIAEPEGYGHSSYFDHAPDLARRLLGVVESLRDDTPQVDLEVVSGALR